MEERWNMIPGFEGKYMISDHGRVKKLFKDRSIVKYLRCHINNNRKKVHLTTKEGKRKQIGVAKTVAYVFVHNPNGFRFIFHKDGNYDNCHWENLYWARTRNGDTENTNPSDPNKPEKWVSIKGYETKYQISSQGRVREVTEDMRILMVQISLWHKKIYKVHLRNSYNRQTILVHRLVAEHFVSNPKNLYYVKHKDGNKLNNHADNLYWSKSPFDDGSPELLTTSISKPRLDDNSIFVMSRLSTIPTKIYCNIEEACREEDFYEEDMEQLLESKIKYIYKKDYEEIYGEYTEVE